MARCRVRAPVLRENTKKQEPPVSIKSTKPFCFVSSFCFGPLYSGVRHHIFGANTHTFRCCSPAGVHRRGYPHRPPPVFFFFSRLPSSCDTCPLFFVFIARRIQRPLSLVNGQVEPELDNKKTHKKSQTRHTIKTKYWYVERNETRPTIILCLLPKKLPRSSSE